ncbi:MAG: insulinase family protein, partial [Bacteroidetes bacterium]|nr:insulinase family protein [Bacteroidota bacterium]
MTVRFFSHASPSFLSCLFVVGLLCAAPNASAQGGSTTSETATARASAIPAASGQLLSSVPEVIQDSLPNGVRILFARVNELPLVEINIIIDAGLSREHSQGRGSAWALAQLLTGGNRERTGEMVTKYLAEMGSTVVPYAHYDYTQLYGRTLSRNFAGTLEVMADGVIAPSLREQELMALQRNSSTRLQRRVSSGERATVAAVRSLCGEEHVLTRYMLPAPEDIAALTTAQLTDFQERWYRPSRTTVIVTGSVDYRFVRTAIIEAFGAWQPPAAGPSLRASIDAPDIIKGGAQELVRLLPEDKTPNGLAYFRFGVRAPLRGDDRFVATILLNTILAEGPESRLRRMFWGRHTISPTFTAAVAFSQDCSY